MVIKVKGILEFSPEDVTRKHRNQSSWKRVAIIKTDCDLDRYYAWFLKKRFNLELNKNLRGTHVTFINDKLEKGIFDQFAPLFKISGTTAIDSTLLTTVGQPYRPIKAGKGGFRRG